jgi:hypothetical protein
MRADKSPWVLFASLALLSLAGDPVFVSAGAVQTPATPRDPAGRVFRLDSLCGANCLWQVARAFGKNCSLHDVGLYAETSACRGTTVEGMLKACAKLGLPAQAVRTTTAELAADPRVAILLLEPNDLMHYVILDKVDGTQVCLLDAAQFRVLSAEELKSVWAGVAILVGNPPPEVSRRHALAVVVQVAALVVILSLVAYSSGSWLAARRARLLPAASKSA